MWVPAEVVFSTPGASMETIKLPADTDDARTNVTEAELIHLEWDMDIGERLLVVTTSLLVLDLETGLSPRFLVKNI